MRISRAPRPTAAAPAEWVSGAAWVDEIAAPEGSSRVRVDSVHFAPGEWHWHGASPTTFMTHLAVQEVAEDGTEAERGAHVDEPEYLAGLLAH